MHKISIILSFFGLWLTSFLSLENQTLLGMGLIFSFGILHGANDLILIDHIDQFKKHTFLKILGSYISVILISVVLFINIPLIALLFFVLVSAYHFGEQNWQELLKNFNKVTSAFYQFNYGILILSALFYFNSIKVEQIIYKISNVSIEAYYFLNLLLVSLFIFFVLSFIIAKKISDFKKEIFKQTFYIAVLFVIFKVSGLIWGFAIYFIFWHSIPSLNDQIKFLYGDFSLSNFKKYLKTALIYWIISLAGIFILYYISADMIIFNALFFSFLASITFPHFIVILKMFKK